MGADVSASTGSVGFWSAFLATLIGATYVVAQIGEWMGLPGSAGGPEASTTSLPLHTGPA